MVYKYRYRRRRYKRKALPYRAKKEVTKIVKRAFKNDLEMKQSYAILAAGLISNTTGSKFFGQSGILSGVDSDELIGTKYKIYGFEYNGNITMNAGYNSESCRIMIVIDHNANGALTNASDLLMDVGATRGVHSPVRYARKSTFRVLYDQKFILAKSNTGGTTTSTNPAVPTGITGTFTSALEVMKTIRVRKKFKVPISVTTYTGALSGTITDIERNAINILLFSTNGGAISIIEHNVSVLYTDA